MGKTNEFCAGIDVGKEVSSFLSGAAQEEPRSRTRRFNATVQDLVHLRDWLSSKDITHVVMESESTGSYWVPIYNTLEGHFIIRNSSTRSCNRSPNADCPYFMLKSNTPFVGSEATPKNTDVCGVRIITCDD